MGFRQGRMASASVFQQLTQKTENHRLAIGHKSGISLAVLTEVLENLAGRTSCDCNNLQQSATARQLFAKQSASVVISITTALWRRTRPSKLVCECLEWRTVWRKAKGAKLHNDIQWLRLIDQLRTMYRVYKAYNFCDLLLSFCTFFKVNAANRTWTVLACVPTAYHQTCLTLQWVWFYLQSTILQTPLNLFAFLSNTENQIKRLFQNDSRSAC